MSYETHLEDWRCKDLFSNRNALLDALKYGKPAETCAIPRRYDDIHITEAVIPSVFPEKKVEKVVDTSN